MNELLSRDQLFISKLTDIIEKNLGNENFGIKELADESGLSHHSLSRRLQTITNKTISQFVREIRLRRALEMLQEEDLTAAEVAYKTGFSSPAYFNKCFHDFFGYPPGTARRIDKINISGVSSDPVIKKKEQKRSVPHTSIYIIGGLLALTVLIYLFYKTRTEDSSSVNEDEHSAQMEKSIAVLPFKNLSDSSGNQYFVDGVMDEILTNLSRIHDLKVVSRISVEQYSERNASTREIAKKLRIDYLLEGSCQKYGNNFRLRVQLIDAQNDRHIWANSYEKEINEIPDLFKIQVQVAESITEELKAKITPEEKQLIEKTPTKNLIAYDLLQRGRAKLENHPYPAYSPGEVNEAESLFHKALKHDSTLARAYTGLAEVLWKRWDNDNTLMKKSNLNLYIDSMLLLANIALSYDDQLAEAYRIRGQYYAVKGSTDQAIAEWDKALKYNPNYGPAYMIKGGIYEELDILKAIQNLEKAAFYNQGSSLIYILTRIAYDYYQAGFPSEGNKYMTEVLSLDGDTVKYLDNLIKYQADTQGNYKRAIEHFTDRYLTDSTNTIILIRLGYFNSLLGNSYESLKYYKKYLSVLQTSGVTTAPLTLFTHIGYSYLQNGYRKEADYYFDKQIEAYKNRLTSVRPGERIMWLYPLACVYSCKGDRAKAYEYLNAFKQNPSFFLTWVILLKNDPQFGSIRHEPEFQEIVREVEAKYLSEHGKVGKWLADKTSSHSITRD